MFPGAYTSLHPQNLMLLVSGLLFIDLICFSMWVAVVAMHTRGSGVLQESYNLVQKMGLAVAREEAERVDTLRYSWHSLQEQVRDTEARLTELEPHFRRQLADDVNAFTGDCDRFFTDYQTVDCYYSHSTFFFLLLFEIMVLLERGRRRSSAADLTASV